MSEVLSRFRLCDAHQVLQLEVMPQFRSLVGLKRPVFFAGDVPYPFPDGIRRAKLRNASWTRATGDEIDDFFVGPRHTHSIPIDGM